MSQQQIKRNMKPEEDILPSHQVTVKLIYVVKMKKRDDIVVSSQNIVNVMTAMIMKERTRENVSGVLRFN